MLLLSILRLVNIECSFFRNSCMCKPKEEGNILCPSERPCPLKVCNCGLIIENIVDLHFSDSCQSYNVIEMETCESSQITKNKYICSTMMIIRRNVKELSLEKQLKMELILSYIYSAIGGDKDTLALFTSSALHNTSYLTVFRAASKEKYCSRGLLMIKDYKNYQILTQISSIDFVSFPEKLEEQNSNVVTSTVNFFKWIMRRSKYTFINMMEALNPDEYRIYIESNCTIKNERWQNRENLYNVMMRVY